jgi:hypothetical protein
MPSDGPIQRSPGTVMVGQNTAAPLTALMEKQTQGNFTVPTGYTAILPSFYLSGTSVATLQGTAELRVI